MRINNPRLFNGDQLATFIKIERWLGLPEGSIQNSTTGITIPSAMFGTLPGLISGNNIYADNILLDSTGTLTGTIYQKFESQQAAINAVKQYKVESGDGIIVTTSSSTLDGGINLDTFTVATDEEFLSGKFKLASLPLAPSSQWASVYELQYLGLSSVIDETTETENFIPAWLPVPGDTINIAKDQFLSAAVYDKDTESLKFTFAINKKAEDGNISTSASIVNVPVGDLVHEYVSGNGIDVNYEHISGATSIAIKVAPSGTNDNKFINLTAAGLGLSGITAAINTAVANAPYAQIVNLDEFSATAAQIEQYLETGAIDTTKNILFVDSDGQTALYFASTDNATSSIVDISQEFISEASDVTAANSEKLMTVKAVSGYVAEQTAATVSVVNEKAVEMLEVTGNIGYWEYTDAATSAFTSGNAVATVPGRVIAVYDDKDEQVYPTITYVKAASTSTLSLADGVSGGTFTIIYAKRIGQTSGQLPVYDVVTETPAEGEEA
jgi:hypothetical protein